MNLTVTAAYYINDRCHRSIHYHCLWPHSTVYTLPQAVLHPPGDKAGIKFPTPAIGSSPERTPLTLLLLTFDNISEPVSSYDEIFPATSPPAGSPGGGPGVGHSRHH